VRRGALLMGALATLNFAVTGNLFRERQTMFVVPPSGGMSF
jgi:hypothetical protein